MSPAARRRLAGAATLACIVAAAAREPPLAGAGTRPGAAPAGDAHADALEHRIAALERRLGVGEATTVRSAAGDAYAALRRREQALAARAEAWLRFVPDGVPVPGGVVTSAFGPRRLHPVLGRVLPHAGVDIAAPHGTPVRTTADGTVHAAVRNPTYGLTVDVRHGPSGYLTRYAHLSRVAVRPGQALRRGDVVGHVGSTGLSTGPHTHYEVFYRGWRRDPIRFLPSGPVAGPPRPGVE